LRALQKYNKNRTIVVCVENYPPIFRDACFLLFFFPSPFRGRKEKKENNIPTPRKRNVQNVKKGDPKNESPNERRPNQRTLKVNCAARYLINERIVATSIVPYFLWNRIKMISASLNSFSVFGFMYVFHARVNSVNSVFIVVCD
jgi:hypothetical protein